MVDRDDWDETETIDFDPVPGPEPDNEGLNVLRIAGLSTLFSEDRSFGTDSEDELRSIGFSSEVIDQLAFRDPDTFNVAEAAFNYLHEIDDAAGYRQARITAWNDIDAEHLRFGAALAYLLLGLASQRERESIASAVALAQIFGEGAFYGLWHSGLWAFPRSRWEELRYLWPYLAPGPGFQEDLYFPEDGQAWDGSTWQRMSADVLDRPFRAQTMEEILELIVARLASAERSLDPVTREYRHALSLITTQQDPPSDAEGIDATPAAGSTFESTIVHGTRAWKGSWWRPGGAFHQHVLTNVRTNLYQDGRRFSWSGLLSHRHRAQAAADFSDWAAGAQLDAVFAHSYGGEIASRAIAYHGLAIKHLVLLSTPRTRRVLAGVAKQVGTGRDVAHVRLSFDVVLWLIRNPSGLTGHGVKDVPLNRKYWSHSVTHNPKVWTVENVKTRAGL